MTVATRTSLPNQKQKQPASERRAAERASKSKSECSAEQRNEAPLKRKAAASLVVFSVNSGAWAHLLTPAMWPW